MQTGQEPPLIMAPKTPTTANRHKDRYQVHQHAKQRFSNRKSLHRKIARMIPTYAHAPTNTHPHPHSLPEPQHHNHNHQQSINIHQFQVIQSLSSQLQKRREYRQALLAKIGEVKRMCEEVRRLKDIRRTRFHANYQQLGQLRKLVDQQDQDIYNLRKETNNMHFRCKEIAFKIASQQYQIQQSLANLHQTLTTLTKKTDQNLLTLHKKTQQQKSQQLRQKDLQCHLSQLLQQKQQKLHTHNLELSQVFVLRFQLGGSFCGFVVRADGCDKRLLLDKEYQAWDRGRDKGREGRDGKEGRFDWNDLRRFVLVYLYRNWRVVMRKISYQSTQYQVLFGEMNNQLVLDDLKRLLKQQKPRPSPKKQQKALIFYSQLKTPQNPKTHLIQTLTNFNNGLIQIHKIHFTQPPQTPQQPSQVQPQQQQLQIHYTYLDQQQLVQKFIYEEHRHVSREKIVKDLKVGDRRAFVVVEVPVVAHKDDIGRYEEVYQFVRRRKGGGMGMGGVRSLSK